MNCNISLSLAKKNPAPPVPAKLDTPTPPKTDATKPAVVTPAAPSPVTPATPAAAAAATPAAQSQPAATPMPKSSMGTYYQPKKEDVTAPQWLPSYYEGNGYKIFGGSHGQGKC